MKEPKSESELKEGAADFVGALNHRQLCQLGNGATVTGINAGQHHFLESARICGFKIPVTAAALKAARMKEHNAKAAPKRKASRKALK